MAVLTISRQAGSNGTLIGKEVAEKLGYHYIDKTHIAQIMKEYGFSTFENTYDSIPTFWDKLDHWRDSTFDFLKEIEVAIAAHGHIVMAGRGGYALLQEFDDVINVRIKAPFEYRVKQVAERLVMPLEEAEKYTKEKDSVRKKFVESDIDFSYTDTTLFDIILDSSIVSTEDCIDLLVKAVKKADTKPHKKSVTGLEINPVLKEYIEKIIGEYH